MNAATPDEVFVDGVRYLRAYPVAAGRCGCCGRDPLVWSAGKVIAGLQQFAREHGRAPVEAEWSRGTPSTPDFATVRRIFGTWRAGVLAAGIEPTRWRGYWTPERIVEAMLDWTVSHGRPPTTTDWAKADASHPVSSTVMLKFGSWNKGLRAAGLTPHRRGSRDNKPPTQPLRSMDARPLVEPIGRWLAETGYGFDVLSERAGVSVRRIYAILHGEQDRVSIETADALLTAMDSNAWHDELAHLYDGEEAAA